MSTGNLLSVEVPDIGDFEDVPIIEIMVSRGEHVAVDDPLLTLESDKATMDVPSPFAGIVKELHVNVGDKVSEGTLLLTIEPSDEGAASDTPPEPASEGASQRASERAGQPASERASQPASERASQPTSERASQPTSERASQPASEPPSSDAPEFAAQAPPHPESDGAAAVYASPSVRRLARELGVELSGVQGSGRKGRITREDVESAARAGPGERPAAPTAGLPGLAPWPSTDFEKQGPVERVERSRIQRISAPNLARNWVMIPHVTHNDETDVTELEAWRKELNEEQARASQTTPSPTGETASPAKYTMLSFLVLASVATLKEFPNFNASLDGDELVLKRYYNIGFAADTPGGLVVPVIKDADKKGLLDIARELGSLSARAREGKLGPAEMSGSTFTISSLGGIGGTSFTPIINAPELAILGVTRTATKPVWNGAEFVPCLMLPLSLSYDHRVIDGAAAARFVAHLGKVLSDLRRALL